MRIASAVVAGLIIAALAVGAYRREYDGSSEGVASALGAALGTLFIGLLVGFVVRYVYVRWMRKQGEVQSHWLLWIAASFLLMSAAGQAANRAEENAKDPTGLARFQDQQRKACDGETEFDFPRIKGATSRPATPEEIGVTAGAGSGLKLVAVEEDGEPIAFVTAAIVSPDEGDEFVVGMNRGVRKTLGGKDRPAVTIDGEKVNVLETSDQVIMTFHRECHAVLVRSGDRETARYVAEPIVTSLR